MIEIGWLAPDGTMYECATMEHNVVAEKLAEKIGWHELDENFNRITADDFLIKNGWVHITRQMIFGHNYLFLHEKHYTEAQKNWLRPKIEENWEDIDPLDKWDWEEENKQ